MAEIFEYMMATDETAMYPDHLEDDCDEHLVQMLYCTLKLNGEAGELAEEVGKALRDDGGKFTADRIHKIHMELGDVLWYVVRICREMKMDPRKILDANLYKLRDRKSRNALKGSGSDR